MKPLLHNSNSKKVESVLLSHRAVAQRESGSKARMSPYLDRGPVDECHNKTILSLNYDLIREVIGMKLSQDLKTRQLLQK